MEITVKNVKYAEFASEETVCFQADIWIDGAFATGVSNDGHGGCHRYDSNKVWKRIDDYARTLPDAVARNFPNKGDTYTYAQTGDYLIDDLVNRALTLKELLPKLKSRFVFTKPGEDGIWLGKKLRQADFKRVTTGIDVDDTKKRLGADQLLNFMSREQALDIYMEQV